MSSHRGRKAGKSRAGLDVVKPPLRKSLVIAGLCGAAAAILGFAAVALAGNVDVPEQAGSAAAKAPSGHQTDREQVIQDFERRYHAADAADQLRALTPAGAQALIRELSAINAKLLAASNAHRKITLNTYVLPVSLPPQKLQRWVSILPAGVAPPKVLYQTFAVSLNGQAYTIAPGHGTHGDRRYYTPPQSDSAVRAATPAETGRAIPLDRKPSDFAGKIVTLEGRLLTGEIVRFEAAAVRGGALLRILLPDPRASFRDARRGVEVVYDRTLVFVLPPQWAHAPGLRLHLASGFSGAPAVEQTPDGSAIAGHFTGHRAIEAGGVKVTLGIIEDYDSIRAAVEAFAAMPHAYRAHSTLLARPHP